MRWVVNMCNWNGLPINFDPPQRVNRNLHVHKTNIINDCT